MRAKSLLRHGVGLLQSRQRPAFGALGVVGETYLRSLQLASAQIFPQSRIPSLHTRARSIFTTPWRWTSPRSPAICVWSTWSSRSTRSSWRNLSPAFSASVRAVLSSVSNSLCIYVCARDLYYAMASDFFSKVASDFRNSTDWQRVSAILERKFPSKYFLDVKFIFEANAKLNSREKRDANGRH